MIRFKWRLYSSFVGLEYSPLSGGTWRWASAECHRWRSRSHCCFLWPPWCRGTAGPPPRPTPTPPPGSSPDGPPFSDSRDRDRFELVRIGSLVVVLPVRWCGRRPRSSWRWSWWTRGPGSTSWPWSRPASHWPPSGTQSWSRCFCQRQVCHRWDSEENYKINHVIGLECSMVMMQHDMGHRGPPGCFWFWELWRPAGRGCARPLHWTPGGTPWAWPPSSRCRRQPIREEDVSLCCRDDTSLEANNSW